MNRSDRADPKSAQQQSVFSELQQYRRRVQSAEAKVAELQGRIDAKEAGVTIQKFNAVKAVLRDLLVAVENEYLSTKDDKKKVPKDIKKAMEAAQKEVRPNAQPDAVAASPLERLPLGAREPLGLDPTKVSFSATPTGIQVKPA